MNEPGGARRRRADGAQSRERILAAAAGIAGERGYDGTTIAAVSARCGLPASSIYWHFASKDELIAAVIESSFERWLATMSLPGAEAGGPAERAAAMAAAVARSLVDSPDFLRLGLMLTLERRPAEPTARARFLEVREITARRVAEAIGQLTPGLPAASVRKLTTYALAGADGLFIAWEIGGDQVDLVALFELHARLLAEAATRELAGP